MTSRCQDHSRAWSDPVESPGTCTDIIFESKKSGGIELEESLVYRHGTISVFCVYCIGINIR